MTLEVVAGRIIAPYAGVSLLTWTSVIGVVLAGISLGNAIGGRIADRRASLRLLGLLLTLAGISSLGILAVGTLQAFTDLTELNRTTLPLIASLALFVTLLFMLPCAVLGTLSPTIAKLALRDLDSTGRTVGRIYAAGSVGSIVGTFATGFVLISWFGTYPIVWGVGLVLITLGLLFLLWDRRLWLIPAVLVLSGVTVLVFYLGWTEGPCTRETNYFCIQVRDEEVGGEPVRVLYLDRLLHSYVSLDDPTRLVYDYEDMYAEATAYVARQREAPRALFIGGGGYTFPRYMETVYPNSDIHVIEIDPGVTQVAYEMLGLRADTSIVSYNEDARTFIERAPQGTYDLIFGDAFNDFSVPYHLTTQEFNDRVQAWLGDGGLYIVNIIDGPYGRFLRAYVHTLRQTFAHVYLAVDLLAWQQSTRSTLVVLASDTPIDREVLQDIDADDGYAQLSRYLLDDGELDALLEEGRAVVLTDRFAPVDQMLLPVFLDQRPR